MSAATVDLYGNLHKKALNRGDDFIYRTQPLQVKKAIWVRRSTLCFLIIFFKYDTAEKLIYRWNFKIKLQHLIEVNEITKI